MPNASKKQKIDAAPNTSASAQAPTRRAMRRLARLSEPLTERYRRLTAELRVLPQFLIVGAQRSGTSSLYSYLVQHPCVVPARVKETHFFDRDFREGLALYRSYFHLASYGSWLARRRASAVMTGEASVAYLANPEVPQRVFDVMPQVKLIALLRNPVDRAYSQYQHRRRREVEAASFEEVVEADKAKLENGWENLKNDGNRRTLGVMHYSYLPRGIYVDQLKAWMSVFPREQFLILRAEDFFADPHAVVQRVVAFLGLPEWSGTRYAKHNAGSYPAGMSVATRAALAAYFAPHNRRLYEFLGVDFGWDEH